MKIFLDDIRNPKDCVSYMYTRIGALNPIYLEPWFVVRNYDEFVDTVSKHIDKITHISFDHDLAEEHYDPGLFNLSEDSIDDSSFKEKTGFDCAVWLKNFYSSKNKSLPVMFVHSMNPAGTQNIVNVFK